MKTKYRISIYLLILSGSVLALINSCKKDNTNKPSEALTDKDGNVYTSVTIGTQVWMVENLRTTKLNDGTPILLVTDGAAWGALTTPGYCWYNNDEASNKAAYGALYNWKAAVNACPVGWHPGGDRDTDAGFIDLGDYCFFWSATVDGSSRAWYRRLNDDNAGVHRRSSRQPNGYSVRCLKN